MEDANVLGNLPDYIGNRHGGKIHHINKRILRGKGIIRLV